jgi:hypothetical protein
MLAKRVLKFGLKFFELVVNPEMCENIFAVFSG